MGPILLTKVPLVVFTSKNFREGSPPGGGAGGVPDINYFSCQGIVHGELL